MITIKYTKKWGNKRRGDIEEVGNDIGLYIVNEGYAIFISGGVTKKSNTKKKKEFDLLRKYGLNETSLSYGRTDVLKALRNIEENKFLKEKKWEK